MKIYSHEFQQRKIPLKARKITSLKRQYISVAELTGDSFFGKTIISYPTKTSFRIKI